MKKIFLVLIIALLAFAYTSCEDPGTEVKYIYLPYDPQNVVGNTEVIGTWIREVANDTRYFGEDGTVEFKNALTGEVSYSGTWTADSTKIYMDLGADGTASYTFSIVYDDPAANNATIYLTPDWLTNPVQIPYRKVIAGVYEYP